MFTPAITEPEPRVSYLLDAMRNALNEQREVIAELFRAVVLVSRPGVAPVLPPPPELSVPMCGALTELEAQVRHNTAFLEFVANNLAL
jgi:hypothetical protein